MAPWILSILKLSILNSQSKLLYLNFWEFVRKAKAHTLTKILSQRCFAIFDSRRYELKTYFKLNYNIYSLLRGFLGRKLNLMRQQ